MFRLEKLEDRYTMLETGETRSSAVSFGKKASQTKLKVETPEEKVHREIFGERKIPICITGKDELIENLTEELIKTRGEFDWMAEEMVHMLMDLGTDDLNLSDIMI